MNEDGSVDLREGEKQKKEGWFSKFYLSHFWQSPVIIGLGLVFLVCLFVLVNMVGYYNDFQSCQGILSTAREEKLPSSDIDCDLDVGSRLVYFFSGQNVQVYAEEQIAGVRQEVEDLINQEKNKQQFLRSQLDNLLVEYSDEVDFGHLQGVDRLEREVDRTAELQQLVEQNISKPSQELAEIKDNLQQFTSLDLGNYQNQTKDYENLNEEQLITEYSKIKTLGNGLKAEIEKQYYKKYPQSSVPRDELFNFDYQDPENFREVFDQAKLDYEDVGDPKSGVEITGNEQVDAYVFGLGEERGYERTPQADEGVLIGNGEMRLQPRALKSWEEMRAAARAEGIDLGLVSGYRQVSLQRDLFWGRFNDYSQSQYGVIYSSEDILAGRADQALDELMQGTAPPGYSRHHTGYTIDIRDNNQPNFLQFKDTPGYAWISANNYLNAKRFGFVPSYPEGLENMGPNPEAWEYVWVDG